MMGLVQQGIHFPHIHKKYLLAVGIQFLEVQECPLCMLLNFYNGLSFTQQDFTVIDL